MNWREGFANSDDPLRKSDILRVVLAVSKSTQEISDIVDFMACLPEGLQSYIAWDVVNNPSTTIDIYERVKCNPSLLANTSVENVQSAWERNHEGNLTPRALDGANAPANEAESSRDEALGQLLRGLSSPRK